LRFRGSAFGGEHVPIIRPLDVAVRGSVFFSSDGLNAFGSAKRCREFFVPLSP